MTSNKKAELYLFSATILAGLGWLFSKQAVAELPPLAFIGFRFVCAAVIIAPFGMKQLARGERQQFFTAGWIGLLQGLSLSLWIYAVSVSDELGVGAFIMSLSMLFVPIWGWMLFKQRPTRPFWASLPFVSAGLYFLSLSGSFSMSTGELFFFISAAFVALHFICNSHHSQTIPVLYLTCVQFLYRWLIGDSFFCLYRILANLNQHEYVGLVCCQRYSGDMSALFHSNQRAKWHKCNQCCSVDDIRAFMDRVDQCCLVKRSDVDQ
ncbi:DMT family transporter [Vibrio parahaemolyticus]|nr:DMT family transporter [Vibrio parahaemolyticus]